MAGLLLLSSTVLAQTRPAPTRIEVADGIYLYRTAPYDEVGLDGNSIAIIENDGVLVFDTNGTPSAAAAVLADIRTLTSQPVRYVVNSHWHWDHWYGTEVYTQAFPDVKVIAHEKTKMMMAGPAIEFNKLGPWASSRQSWKMWPKPRLRRRDGGTLVLGRRARGDVAPHDGPGDRGDRGR